VRVQQWLHPILELVGNLLQRFTGPEVGMALDRASWWAQVATLQLSGHDLDWITKFCRERRQQ